MALKGISGSLASAELLETLASDDAQPGPLRRVLAAARQALGPASPPRQIFDLLVCPLLRELALEAVVVRDDRAPLIVCACRPAHREHVAHPLHPAHAVALIAIGPW
ncbi:MAG TPA: hypothetical protein VNC21_05835, partial [Vicinamibacterales bacterium]|nr:hypothetical protein [Vicinamibacterales bacterium]